MTVYHPHSGLAPTLDHFGDYKRSPDSSGDVRRPVPPDETPWEPFRSRLDFEFAELATEARLNRSQIERLLRIMNKAAENGSQFTLRSYKDLEDTWERASHSQSLVSGLEKHDDGYLSDYQQPQVDLISVQFKQEKRTYQLHSRPLMQWALDQLSDPSLIPYTVWDAHQLFKYNSEAQEWTRFIHEPFTANQWWQIQVSGLSGSSDTQY